MNNLSDLILTWVAFITITLIVIMGIIFFAVSYNDYLNKQKCAKWEEKIIHQEAYRSYRLFGRTMLPVDNPAMNVKQEVCTKLK